VTQTIFSDSSDNEEEVPAKEVFHSLMLSSRHLLA